MRRNNVVDLKPTTQPKAQTLKYEKITRTIPKDKWFSARTEPHPNQQEVFLALQANRSLPRPKPMKSILEKSHKSSEQYCEYHQDYGHATSDCSVLAKAIEELNVFKNATSQQGPRVVNIARERQPPPRRSLGSPRTR